MSDRSVRVPFEGRQWNIPADGGPVGTSTTTTLGFGVADYGTLPFGSGSTYTTPPSSRGWHVTADDRSVGVPSETRAWRVPFESRTIGA